MHVIKTDKGYIKGTARGGYSFTTKAHARHFDRIELLGKYEPIAADLKEHYGCKLVEAETHGEKVEV